jgi:hypothetical protein
MITGSGRVSLLSGRIWRYRVGFMLNGLDPLRYVSAYPAVRLVAWRVAGWAEPVGRLGFGPIG